MVEFARDPVPKEFVLHTHPTAENNYDFRITDQDPETVFITPEFDLDRWDQCPTGSKTGFCGKDELGEELFSPFWNDDRFLSPDTTSWGYIQQILTGWKDLRDDPFTFISDF